MLLCTGIIQVLNTLGPRDANRRHDKRGELSIDIGVSGKIKDGSYGDPSLECSKECECDSGGVWQA